MYCRMKRKSMRVRVHTPRLPPFIFTLVNSNNQTIFGQFNYLYRIVPFLLPFSSTFFLSRHIFITRMFSRNLARAIQGPKFQYQLQQRCFSLGDWFRSWKDAAQTQRLIYPPPASHFTTKNRIIDVWITEKQDLYNYINVKPPLLLNFTFATPENNKVTQALFDVLSDKSKYPNAMIIQCTWLPYCRLYRRQGINDGLRCRSKLPCVIVLQHQLPVGRFVPDVANFSEEDVVEFLKSVN
ncbi:conserved hypothetical protein [Lodderomyces elongisporus NRRL YB-4239]|uniref:Uncharacterized protein n=1 Tax=Lodderomyces elongisporus (strain ATCC 11503 / CBS 2605 / JCM 1781 / NBRC 1676 / NRRL YB-4239) TaxID=379508 RepID=A5DS88_LODEL|nr:conserved hypothetical protein [Lodderomyces elongisporus NRRL YB-4239]